MKKTNHRKGGDVPLTRAKRGRGAPKKVRKEGEEILSNGFYARQWEWIKKEAVLVHQDGAQYLRWVVDLHIDSITASRTGPVATQEEDKTFEQLTSSKK